MALLGMIVLASGCQSLDGGASRALDAPAPDVFAAAARALQRWPEGEFDRDERMIQTDWLMWRDQPTHLLTRYEGSSWTRVRVRVTVAARGEEHAELHVRAHCQERPAAGRLAYRWHPVATPSGYEQELVDSIELELHRGRDRTEPKGDG